MSSEKMVLRQPATTIAHQEPPPRTDIFNVPPKAQLEALVEISKLIADVIRQQKLSVKMGKNNEHVILEGWTLLGTFLGLGTKEKLVVDNKDGSYTAYVELVNEKTGIAARSGSGHCGRDEPYWKSKSNAQRRSMAITRAISKAYRSSFGYVMKMAGFEVTPAEEMDAYYQRGQETSQNKNQPQKSQVPPTPPNIPQTNNGVSTYEKHKANVGEQAVKKFHQYDPMMTEWLEKGLAEQGVHKDHWAAIAEALHDKPLSEARKIAVDVVKKAVVKE